MGYRGRSAVTHYDGAACEWQRSAMRPDTAQDQERQTGRSGDFPMGHSIIMTRGRFKIINEITKKIFYRVNKKKNTDSQDKTF